MFSALCSWFSYCHSHLLTPSHPIFNTHLSLQNSCRAEMGIHLGGMSRDGHPLPFQLPLVVTLVQGEERKQD
jgi:hypothetical protein